MQLTTVWFILITVLWTGYFVLEGFDFGVGMLFPVLGRGKAVVDTSTVDHASQTTEGELKRRVLLNTIGPVWDGNEVWVLTAGGATFAAFPSWYATMFSGLYLPLLLILVALIVRALAFDYRGKRDTIAWRRGWDAAIVFGSFVPALLWGVALTNVVRGLPINAAHEYVGNFFTLLNPVSLLGGVTVVALFLTHGALFIALKTEGDIRLEARRLALQLGVAAAALAVVFLVLINASSGSAASWAVAGVAAIALVSGLFFAWQGREGWAFAGTFVAIGAAVCCLFLALFPDVMPSSLNPAWSLTAENAASGSYTLKIMTGVALLFTPLVVVYEGWTYWVFRRRIGTQHIPVPRPLMRPFDPRILRLAPRARAPIATLAVLSAATGATAIALAFAVASLVVAMVRGATLTGPVVAVATLFGLRAAFSAGTEAVAAWAGTRVSTQARRRLLGTWLSRTADERPTPGTALTLATQGCASIEPYVARYLPALVSAAVLPPLAIIAMALLDPLSAVIALVTVPLLPLFAALIGRTTADETRLRWRSMAALSGHFLDVMRGLPTLVAYGRADNQARTIDDVSQQHRRSTMQTLRLAFLSSAALELLATISVALVAVTVGIRLAAGNLDLGTGLTVILLAPEAYWPIRRMGAEFHSAADGAQALSAVCDVLASASASASAGAPAGASATGVAPRVHLRGVGYTYPGASGPALVEVDGDFGVGLTLLTGPSGAGKTTLLELVAGLRLPTEGSIEAPQAHLVTQRPFLAAGTIRDNLALGAVHGTVEDSTPGLWDALCQVGMDGVVASLPLGLDATLGDDGVGLSAGQRSRLAMARLLLCDAPLLLLDEPTAHLDPESAEVVHRLVRQLATTRAVVVVTHRPELISHAGQVIALAGRLTPVGG